MLHNREGTVMQLNGFLIPRNKNPKLDWTTAAVRFAETRSQFLTQVHVPPAIVGIWSFVCFPFKGLTDRPLEDLTQEEINHIKTKTRELILLDRSRKYDRNHEIEVIFRAELEYPPYSLADNWDGHTVARRHWAEEVYRHSGINI